MPELKTDSTTPGTLFGTLTAVVVNSDTLCTVSLKTYSRILDVTWTGQTQSGATIIETDKSTGKFTVSGIALDAQAVSSGQFINVTYISQ